MRYEHIISLGFYCGVAQEIERLGFRDGAYPFDWCISKDYKGVERAIEEHFKDWLKQETLEQSIVDPKNYRNMYNVQFFHDFSKYKTLKKQLPKVQNKYDRRVEKFFNSIRETTLFIRCINDDNGEEEIRYWDENVGYIEKILKSYNKNNRIVFIANEELREEYCNIEIYYVEQDKCVEKTVDEILKEIDYDTIKRRKNLEFYERKMLSKVSKEAREKMICWRIMEKFYSVLKPVKYCDRKY